MRDSQHLLHHSCGNAGASDISGKTVLRVTSVFPPLFFLLLSVKRNGSLCYGRMPNFLPNVTPFPSSPSGAFCSPIPHQMPIRKSQKSLLVVHIQFDPLFVVESPRISVTFPPPLVCPHGFPSSTFPVLEEGAFRPKAPSMVP